MIISRTPLRISFMGGGSDLPAFYRQDAGAVVSTAINKYIYLSVNKKFDLGIRASYSVTEIVERLGELRHELIRESLRLTGVHQGIEITSISDIPSSGTGMGSSSTYTVGLLNALHAYQGRHAGAERLAQEACQIEIDVCRKPIGKQDQYIAAYGGMQFLRFNPDGTTFVDPIICSPETKAELQRRLLLFYTGVTRSADPILGEQQRNIAANPEVRSALRRMAQMAHEMRDTLCANDLDRFGEMLHESWVLKKSLAGGVSNPRIDGYYERGRQYGALGGKILGAGGGGFLLLYAHTEHHASIVSALSGLSLTPFCFEPQGSKIIYVEEERCALPGC
jgi:D-glycero-alpha-D-manno-heptose-7-phosphate kinase